MLEVKNLTKIYNITKVAVDDISFTVNNGDIFAFVGHNGAGKTTTIKAIVGINDFDKGDILIENISIKKDPIACKKLMAFLPDSPDLYEHLTGIGYLNFIANIFEVSEKKRNELITKYSELFEIESNLGDLISSYSHGMKQKLAIISALIHEPKIYIFDEPFVGLDPKATHNLKEIMKEKCAKGCSFFFSTHILEVAEKICNKIAIIKNGKLVICDDMKKVVKQKSLEEIFMELTEHE